METEAHTAEELLALNEQRGSSLEEVDCLPCAKVIVTLYYAIIV